VDRISIDAGPNLQVEILGEFLVYCIWCESSGGLPHEKPGTAKAAKRSSALPKAGAKSNERSDPYQLETTPCGEKVQIIIATGRDG
jgi:hypothetical protein